MVGCEVAVASTLGSVGEEDGSWVGDAASPVGGGNDGAVAVFTCPAQPTIANIKSSAIDLAQFER